MASNNPSPESHSSHNISREDIVRRARELWDSRGQPVGQDEAIWLEAERELSGRAASSRGSQSSQSDQSDQSGSAPSGRRSGSRSSGRTQRGDGGEGSAADRTARENSQRDPNFERGD